VDFESLSEVTWRLIELLPFEVHIKQALIETRDLGSRCDQLREALKALQSESDR
jgi:Lon protease-like protein